MGLEITQDNQRGRVKVEDEMTIYTVAQHWQQLQPLLAQVKAIELDLAAVNEIDSAGVQLLLALKQASQRLHNDFAISQVSDPVCQLLQLLHLQPALLPADAAREEEPAHG